MKKQIVFTKFIPRIFATIIDLVLISMIMTPFMNILAKYWFLYIFNSFFLEYAIDMNNVEAMSIAIRTPEFSSYITSSRFFSYFGALFLVNTIIIANYFIFFWYKFGATPGKIILKMKIVDADTYERPPLGRLIRRFFAYITLAIGMWQIVVSKKGQAMHDKIANTVVIKS